MARSLLKQRLDNDRKRDEAFDAALKASRREKKTRDYRDLADALARAREHAPYLIRAAQDWRPQLRTHDEARARLAAARFLFARYAAPAYLERVWLETEDLAEREIAFRKTCWFAVVSGGSLHRLATSAFLTRRETHAFLAAPGELAFAQALVFAIASSYTADAALARRLAVSKLGLTPVRIEPFWREATRFFAAHPAPRETIDDLCDFLLARIVDEPGFSLKGRTLRSLTALETEWREQLMIVRRVGETRWPGLAMADWVAASSDPRHPLFGSTWSVVQLTSTRELAEEGGALRHCVSNYARACEHGYASIWSLRRRRDGRMERALTLELNAKRKLVQVRGRANRLANAEEQAALKVWAAERGIEYSGR